MAKRNAATPEQKTVAVIASRFDAANLSDAWVPDIGARAAVLLEDDPTRPGAAYLRRAVKLVATTRRAIEAGNAAGAAMAAAGALQAAWQAEMIEAKAHWFAPEVAPRVAAANKRTQKLAAFAVKGNEARRRYPQATKDRWIDLARDDPHLRRLRESSARECAKKIAEREKLPPAAVETIRKVI